MGELPVVLVPSLLGSPRLYAEQLPALWRFGPVTVASHQHDGTLGAIAERILASAPPRFALVGLSMGGYVAFEIMRRAADRVDRLALLDTTARPDTAEQSRRRRQQMALANAGLFREVVDTLFPLWISPARHSDEALRRVVRQMADEIGPDAFARQQWAILNRPDSRPDLAAIGCPTLALAGADDGLTTPEHASEIADGVRDGRLVVVPECGHLSTLEQPEAVTAALVEWLER
jgi:pimeloyl-ACP methyl ester carboxylesterase